MFHDDSNDVKEVACARGEYFPSDRKEAVILLITSERINSIINQSQRLAEPRQLIQLSILLQMIIGIIGLPHCC